MQKVDLVIAGVGALALVATVLGIVFYEEVAGTDTAEFEEYTEGGAFQMEPASVTPGAARPFTFDLADNATAASFDVTVNVGGTAVLAGSVNVEVRVQSPTGNTSDPESGTITIAAGSITGASGSTTVPISYRWASPPEPRDLEEGEPVDATRSWTEPVTVLVTITGPGNNGDQLTYTVDIEGDQTLYRRAPPEIPDPQGGQ